MSARIEALLLDAVGTVLHLREPPASVYVRIAAQHGITRAVAEVARALEASRIAPPPLEGVPLALVPARERDGWREIVRGALGDDAADGPCFDAIFAAFARAEAWALAPGAGAALESARALGLRCAIVSNMDARLSPLLDALGLGAVLDAVVLPSTCGFAKPDPRIFAFALERLGVPAAAALYVGDREADCVAAARAAGLHAWRYDPAAPEGAPDRIARWDELPKRLSAFARASRAG